MKTHLIQVTDVSEEKQDKNGRIYKNVEFTNPNKVTAVDETTGEIVEVRVEGARASIPRYKEDYLRDKQHFMFDAKIGEKTPGMVVTLPVRPYTIGEHTVNTYSTVVFGDTNALLWRTRVLNAFRRNGHKVTEYITPDKMDEAHLDQTEPQSQSPAIEENEKSSSPGAFVKVNSTQESEEDSQPMEVESSTEEPDRKVEVKKQIVF